MRMVVRNPNPITYSQPDKRSNNEHHYFCQDCRSMGEGKSPNLDR
nr:MAG TPA: Glutathione-dependent formaldehyde-activating enzyme [Caudoviricetes sp.]